MKVQQQFVQVGERRVFVRHAGQGPAVVLLHQSPESGLSMLPWFEDLSDHCAVFAPDTPGFGLSDPLPMAQPTVPDLADALGRLLDALGLQRVLLFGVHTGASIAARLARDQPGRVAALVCDGLSAFSAEERQPLLDGYLPPFEPAWDGTHLLWLWARIREQTLFFPWHVGTAAARLTGYPLAPAEAIHRAVMELLDAGDGYRAGYRAPLLYEYGAAGAAQISVPTWLLYRQADVLRPHLERLPPLPAHVQALAMADRAALIAQTLMAFSGQAAAASQVQAADSVAHAVASGRRLVETSLGALSILLRPGDRSRTELVMGDIGTPAAIPDDAEPGANVVVLELPGHGASSGFAPLDILSGTWLRLLPEALQSLGVDSLHLRANGGACAFAAALAPLLGPRCRRLSLTDPMPLTADERAQFLQGLPDWQPQATGAHLIAAWNWARLKHLFWPWLPADADAAIAAAAPPPRRVHADVVEMLRAGPLWAPLWRAALESDPWPAARRAPCELRVLSGSSQQRMALAARLGGEGLDRTTLAPVVNRYTAA